MTAYVWPEIDWDELRAERRKRFSELLASLKLDHAIVSGFDNLRYATDYRATLTYDSNLDFYSALVGVDGQSVLFAVDVAEAEDDPLPTYPWIRRRVPGTSWQLLSTEHETYVRALVRELEAARAERVGVELLHFEIMDALRQALPTVDWVPIKWELLKLRERKMPLEIELLEAASEVGSMAMSAALECVAEGMADADFPAIARDVANRNGVEVVSHSTIVSQGIGKYDSWFPRGRRLWAGDCFLMDFGVYGVGGYCHDFCRTAFIGEPHPRIAAAHRAVVESLLEGATMAKPGVRSSEIGRVVNAGLKARGFPPVPYAVGHGIGLRLTELPALDRPEVMREDALLAEGMVICIEPSTYVDLDGTTVAVKEEEQYVVEATGLRQITKTRRLSV